jgi:hypothetical protein
MEKNFTIFKELKKKGEDKKEEEDIKAVERMFMENPKADKEEEEDQYEEDSDEEDLNK